MAEFLAAMIAFPTAIFTMLLLVAALYWMMVILGAVDIEFIEIDGLMETVDSAADSVLESLGPADIGDLDVDVDLDVDADADVDAESGGAGWFASMLSLVGLTGVPVTISFSLVILFGWMCSMIAMSLVSNILPHGGTLVVILILIGLGSAMAGSLLASVMVRPLRKAYQSELAPLRRDFIGKTCRVISAVADSEGGRVEIEDGGAGLIVPVRSPMGRLERGEEGLIFDYHEEEEVFLVSSLQE